MRNLSRLSVVMWFLATTIALHSQVSDKVTILSGKILFEPDSIYPLKPYSIIVEKSWPITFSEFEQVRIDTSDYSFSIRMDPEELTYGNIIVNFFSEIDSTAKERNGYWGLPGFRKSIFGSDGIRYQKYIQRILYSGVKFVIEPGDNLHMTINYNNADSYNRASVHFSGTGAANNNLNNLSYAFVFDSESFRLPLEEGLNREDDLLADKWVDLQQAKDSISNAYFRLLHTDMLFDNLKTKHALIRASLYGSDQTVDEKRAIARHYYSFLDTLTLKPTYLNSLQFRGFLGFYLEYINRIITGRDVPYNDSETNNSLARSIFEKELLKTFLYERLKSQMETVNFYKTNAFEYEDYMEQFPNSPEAYRLTLIHKKRFPVSNGQPAPELLLIDSLGKTKQLSDLKGKVVLIFRYFPGRLGVDEQKQLEALREKFNGIGIVLVALSNRSNEPGESFNPLVDYYVKEGINENLRSYKFMYQSSHTFIVRKNGLIEDCVYKLNIPDETIEKLRSESYTAWTRLDVFAQRHTLGIILGFSILLSLALVVILRAKLKQRRQLLIKRQLNSELKAIRSQLNPHFLFNSLNSLQNFINKSDIKTANKHLSRFSQLMRWIIELSEKESISLQEELKFNKTFIELEQMRYGFNCTFDIDDSIDQFNVEIPSMIIQPFIENAIVHAMADLGEEGKLAVSVRETDNNKIFVEIVDNGLGFEVGTDKGFGLRSSRERIDLINAQNKAKIELQIRSPSNTATGKGTTVKLIIPKKY
ncbi:MAG: histidine kinase [Bacteroidota bacterium]|nr:histidine kinase [Bacteroidota bacterium]